MTALHYSRPSILLIACCCLLSQIASLSAAGESISDSKAGCPVIEQDAETAKWWQVEWSDGAHVATLRNAAGADLLTVELDMDGPSTPLLLGWEVLPRYGGTVGLLHYYSGATGGHMSADITRYVVVKLDQPGLVGNIDASVNLAGTRWIELADGTLAEEDILECQLTELDWQSDRLVYTNSDGASSIPLF